MWFLLHKTFLTSKSPCFGLYARCYGSNETLPTMYFLLVRFVDGGLRVSFLTNPSLLLECSPLVRYTSHFLLEASSFEDFIACGRSAFICWLRHDSLVGMVQA
ncbi:hypothetical protein PMIN06_010776 [Paraphaeosphaeria minitans]